MVTLLRVPGTRASALIAPPLLAKISTGPAPSASMMRVHVVGLLLGGVVGAAVLARAPAEAARVVGDDGAVGEVRARASKSAGVHGLGDQQQWRAARSAAGSGPWTSYARVAPGTSRVWVSVMPSPHREHQTRRR